jgi:hypothetical protein
MPMNFRISDLAPVGLIVESITQLDDAILVAARAGIQVATCPLCGSPSRRVHSRYVREVSDLRAQVGAYGFGSWHAGFVAIPHIAGDGFSPNALTRPCFSFGHAGPAGWIASFIILDWPSAAGRQRTSPSV